MRIGTVRAHLFWRGANTNVFTVMMSKVREVRPLLTRRMDMWEAGKLSELLQEAQRCDKQLSASLGPMTLEQLERTFNQLMLEGRVCSAMRLMTECGGGGDLDPEDEAQGKTGPLGKSVYEVLQAKHPTRRSPDPSSFLENESLPPLQNGHH